MPEHTAAAPAGQAGHEPDQPAGDQAGGQPGPDGTSAAPGGLRARWAVVSRLLASRPVRWGFVAATVGLGCYAVAREWTNVRTALASLGVLPVAGALLSVLGGTFCSMLAWRRLLAAHGSPLPVRAGARVLFIGQLGKYLPGSVWPVLAQMELANAHQVPRHRSASASVLAMLMSLLSGLLIALVTLPFAGGSTAYWWAFLAAPVLLVCLYPRVLNALLARLLRVARRPPLEQPLTGRAIAGALAWSAGTWVCYGLQIWLLATRLGASEGRMALLAIGGFAFAWCVGFLVVIAPAGAGVREVLLVAALAPVLGVADATAVALVSRVLMTVGDLVAAAVAAAVSRGPAVRERGAGAG